MACLPQTYHRQIYAGLIIAQTCAQHTNQGHLCNYTMCVGIIFNIMYNYHLLEQYESINYTITFKNMGKRRDRRNTLHVSLHCNNKHYKQTINYNFPELNTIQIALFPNGSEMWCQSLHTTHTTQIGTKKVEKEENTRYRN